MHNPYPVTAEQLVGMGVSVDVLDCIVIPKVKSRITYTGESYLNYNATAEQLRISIRYHSRQILVHSNHFADYYGITQQMYINRYTAMLEQYKL